MAVITTDILVEGVKRDELLEWLSVPDHHDRFLNGAWKSANRKGDKEWELELEVPPKTRTIGYRIEDVDESHGGRRLLLSTSGKRTSGKLHYSLRTMKPSRNTLVTMHMDYDPGGGLGFLINSVNLGTCLEEAFKSTLSNMAREIYADFAE